jgi:predicted TIM-barrel fold metal-dependent hydrolase
MQRAMDRLQSSIRYPEACVVDCAQRVERQRAKEQQLESMQARLAEQQKRLEELQEAARKQGFGSSVYEP